MWEVLDAYKREGEDIDRTIASTGLSEREQRAALRFYARFSEEIEDLIALRGAAAAE